MNQSTASNITTVAALLGLVVMSYCSFQLSQVRDEIKQPRPATETQIMQTMSTDVVNTTTGFTTTVVTTRGEDESKEAFKARHLDMCIEMRDAENEEPK